jgi:hypothetical protein
VKHKINFCLAIAVLFLAGSFSCAHASEWKSTRVTPLHVSASGRYFETADGRPWFWLGDTSWSLLNTYTPEEANTYLAARAKMGFTLVQMVAAWDGGTKSESGLKPNANTAGVQPWRNHDPLQPNEAYWKNVDAVVAMAAKDHIYVGLLPAWGSFVVDYKMITMANAEAYGRWLGQRYKNASNIVWIVDGDRDVIWSGKGSEKFSDNANVWRAIGHGLQKGDGGVHPITFHPGGAVRNNQQEKWLAADMIQTWAWYKDIPKDLAIDYSLTPTKPVILAEGAYEEGPEYPTKPITPLIVRKQAYWTYLSGAFFTYGHNDMWRKNPTWKASLFSGGAKNMRTLRALFASLPWWELQPDQSLFASGAGSGANYNAAAVAADGSWAMVYFSSSATAELQLDRLKGQRFVATWIDPATGRRLPKMAYSGLAKRTFTTPKDWPDAVLLIQKAR